MLFVTAVLVLGTTACVPWARGPTLDEKLATLRERYPGELFFVGRSFEGLPLTHVLYGPEAGGGVTADFLYGDCEPPDDGGCPLPLELQETVCGDGRTIVAIYANDPAMERRAASALRPLGGAARSEPKIVLGEGGSC